MSNQSRCEGQCLWNKALSRINSLKCLWRRVHRVKVICSGSVTSNADRFSFQIIFDASFLTALMFGLPSLNMVVQLSYSGYAINFPGTFGIKSGWNHGFNTRQLCLFRYQQMLLCRPCVLEGETWTSLSTMLKRSMGFEWKSAWKICASRASWKLI